MNTSSVNASMSVCVRYKDVIIKVTGRANFTSSVDFKALVNGLRQQGHGYFILDLSECQLMDSTFLGVLAGLGMKMKGGQDGGAPAGIALCRPSPRIADLLDNLGVASLFPVLGASAASGDSLQPVAPGADVDKRDVSRTCLEAHQTLMEINPANAARFKDVAAYLAEDLQRMDAAGGAVKSEA